MKRNTRPKSVPACASCKKSKVRCEILDDITQECIQKVRCHRCKTLQLQCSYESMDKSIFYTGPAHKTDQVVGVNGEKNHQQQNPVASPSTSRNSSAVVRSKTGQTAVDLECLPRHMWHFHRGSAGQWHYDGIFHYEDSLDWAQPLGAIKQLTNRYLASVVTRPRMLAAATTVSASGIDVLEDILSAEQIKNLLGIFEEKYVPWLNFSLIRTSRHLRANTRSVVAPKLEAAAEDALSRILLHPVPSESLEAIQSLLILALWAPICGGSGDNQRDGHLLLASAISMAKNIRLNEAPDRLQALKDLQSMGHTFDEAQVADTANRTRLWLALTNTDSLLCIGTSRNRSARETASHKNSFPLPVLSNLNIPPSLSEARDTRLELLGDILDATEAGLQVWLDSLDGVKKWYDDVTGSLQRLGHLERLIMPLPVVSDHDNFYFRMLIFIYRVCRLLVTYHAFYTSRMLFIFAGSTPDPTFFEGLIPHSLDILAIWCKDGFHATEGNLLCLMEADPYLLGTSPDIIFQMTSLVAAHHVSFKFFVLNSRLKALQGVSDFMIAKCVGVLNAAAYSEDHPASRSATLIQGLQALWDNRDEMFTTYNPLFTLEDGFAKPTGVYDDQSNMTGSMHDTMKENLQMLYEGAS
ncbi:hypothetical protein D9758_011535 [Tetrapyrgos nigripes]|uniref:Zn(2)-C6 fungal-type domain-containing protein n=1 Tax=Tetrapyrgos nigripes TaxID=182062 RepID=A0A8H5FQF8_9AGAR|nr:hypothetical protein D9758_011535 [Tetrapyrgos nigripes]